MPSVLAVSPDLLVIQGEARRGQEVASGSELLKHCGDELGVCEGSALDHKAVSMLNVANESDIESSSDSSSSSSSSAEQELEKLASSCNIASDVHEPGLWKTRGGKFHVESSKAEGFFRCGTAITKTSWRCVHPPKFVSPKCMKDASGQQTHDHTILQIMKII